MSANSDTSPSGAVRAAVDIRRCPWVRPLVGVYANDFASVASLFAGNPADPAAWRDTIARVQRAPRANRAAMAGLVAAQLARRQAPAEARQAAARSADPACVAVVTGQQAGLFGGPLYTLLKAVTTIQLARQVERDHGVPAVAVFWVDEEDHDWQEVSTVEVLDAECAPRAIGVTAVDGAGDRPISTLTLEAGIDTAIAELTQALPPTEFTAEVLAALRTCYQPGTGVAGAFAKWIETLLGRHGLVAFESADGLAKPFVADLFAREFEQPSRTAALVRETSAAMTRLGHEPQVDPAEDSVALFYVDAAGRKPIKRRGAEFAVDDMARPAAAFAEEARNAPSHFSPNVLLRPLVQDRLFPTVCYVGGPSELAYQAQLKALYADAGVEAPLLYSRASATLLDSGAIKFIERNDVPLEALQSQDDSVLNQLLERQLPPEIDRILDEAGQDLSRRAQALKDAVGVVDATLTGTVDTTVDKMRESLKTLHHKIIQASKRKDETLRRQFTRARAVAFPGGQPQERAVNLIYFLNRYGLTLGDRLIDALPLDSSKHTTY